MEKLIADELMDSELERAFNCPSDRYVFIESHDPKTIVDPFHCHASIEINFLHDCDMVYSFSGEEVELKHGRFCVFWAAHPHRAVHVSKSGLMTNAYVSLSEFLRWRIQPDFIGNLLSGAVLCSKEATQSDRALVKRWTDEAENADPSWQKLHALEIQSRLTRLAVEGWDVLLPPNRIPPKKMIGEKAIVQFDKMLRYITENFSDRITIDDVAEAGGVSANYAMSLFRKILGNTIKEHLIDIRIFHAKMLLTETDDKILSIAMDCGFGSLSAFYDIFQSKVGESPAAFRKEQLAAQES